MLQLVINFQKPTRRHSRATGARGTTRLYYTPKGNTHKLRLLKMVSVHFDLSLYIQVEDNIGPISILERIQVPRIIEHSAHTLGLRPILN